MLVVMLILLMGSAAAVVAVRSTNFELRAAGHMRRVAQAEYAAEAGLVSAMGYVDTLNTADFIDAMSQTAANQSTLAEADRLPAPYERPIATGKPVYRLASSMAELAPSGAPLEETSPSVAEPYVRRFVVDVYDVHEMTGVIAGERSDGASQLRFMQATYTSRGRVQLVGDSYLDEAAGTVSPNDSGRFEFEAAADARAQGISGPYGG